MSAVAVFSACGFGYPENSMQKKTWLISASFSCGCFALLFLRSWIRESAAREFFMTPLWGVALLLALVALVLRLRAKDE